MNEYYIGNVVRCTATFTDPNDADSNIDPTSVVAKYLDPNDDVQTVPSTDVTNSAVGVYYFDLTLTLSGLYRYSFEGTGAAVAWNEGAFKSKTQRVST